MKYIIPTSTLLIIASIIHTGCNGPAARRNGQEITIKGQLESASNISLFFDELTPTDVLPIDSIYTDENGKFMFNMFVEGASFYRLGIDNTNFITLSLEPGETITVSGNASNLPNTYNVKGSVGSQILWDLNQSRLRGLETMDSLRSIFNESLFDNNFTQVRYQLMDAYNDIKIEQRNKALEVIRQNPSNLASILALYYTFDNNLLINEDEHFEYFQKLSKTLCNLYPANKHVMDLKRRINEHAQRIAELQEIEKNLAIGMPAPEIALPDPNGQIVSLSSLRGKVVLINFWAAWCPPCRQSNLILVDIYNQNKERGFEILGVSLDRTREQWVTAIENDNLDWINVSDLRFMNSPVVEVYNVQNIPYNLLIDRRGHIVAKNLSSDKLTAYLNDLL